MVKADKPNKLDQAMLDALASVERLEQEKTGAPTVEVSEATPPAATDDAAALQTARQESEALREQLLRLAADFDNYRKRSRREQDDVRRFGIDRLLGDVLPILDNLDRALEHSGDSQDPVILGVRMVAKQFHDVLQAHGVKPFDSAGRPFDPERHEAVGQEPAGSSAAGTVLREMQRGYMIHDRLLRPARVTVAAAAEQSASQKLS